MAERDTYIIEMIVLNCDEILSFISGMSYYDFREDRKTQNACAMSVINLGELVSVISKDTKRNHPEVEWSGIHKFRSKTAHTYYDQKRYNLKVLWNVCSSDVPKLKSQCISILGDEIKSEKTYKTKKLFSFFRK